MLSTSAGDRDDVCRRGHCVQCTYNAAKASNDSSMGSLSAVGFSIDGDCGGCEEGGAVNDTHIVRLVLWMSKALGMLVVGVTAATNTATVKGAVNDTRIARLALWTSMYCAQRKKRPTTSQ